jgi:hypothetical protein
MATLPGLSGNPVEPEPETISAWINFEALPLLKALRRLVGGRDVQEGVQVFRGAGSPEGVVAASVGALFLRTDGGAATTLYVKESSPSPAAGWVSK